MKHNILFRILLCTLIVSAAFYIRFLSDTEAVHTMSGGGYIHSPQNRNITFSDLAESLFDVKSR